jgi:hypothetical protein
MDHNIDFIIWLDDNTFLFIWNFPLLIFAKIFVIVATCREQIFAKTKMNLMKILRNIESENYRFNPSSHLCNATASQPGKAAQFFQNFTECFKFLY